MKEKKVKEFDIVDGVLRVFNNIYNKTDVVIPNDVIKIGACAVNSRNSLTSITIPEGVIEIGDFAFGSCPWLTSITIPKSVTEIGKCAFWNCQSLTSVTIPDSVTEIGYSAFWKCPNLVNFNASNEKFYLLDNDNQYELICNFIRKYNTKNTYTEADINRYKGFIMLTKEKMISELKTEIDTFIRVARTFMKPLDYAKIEKANDNFDKEDLMPILENKPLIEFMCYNMENAFTLKEISRLIDVAIKAGNTEIKALLLNYKNNHFGDEFIDDLSLDDEDYEFGNNLDGDFGKGK